MLTVVLLIALADAFGLVGIIVAPLLSVVCQILWSRLVSHRLAAGAAAQVSDLVARQERLRATIAAMDEPPLPLVTSSMERLTRLIEKAEPILQAALPADPSELSCCTLRIPIPNQEEIEMATPKMVTDMAQLWQQGIRSAHRFDERTHGWLGMLAGAAQQALKPDSAITAAAIAYFAIFSLFPLTLLSISIASFSLGPLMDQQLIVQRLEFIAPALGQLLGQNIDEIIRARGPVTGVALVGLIWSASTFFYMLTETLNEIWGNKRSRPVWKRRGLAILFVLAFVGPILFLASFAGSMIANLRTWLPDQIIPIVGGVSLVLAILLDVALFMVLYLMLPHGASTWREILPGAIGAGLLWELAKKAFLFFVSTYISVSNLVYGSVAAIIAILTWAYLSGLIFLFGAYLSVSYFQKRQQQEAAAGQNQ